MKTLRVLALCNAAFLLAAVQSPAQLLSWEEPGVGPDLESSPLSVGYISSSMLFTVSGNGGGNYLPPGETDWNNALELAGTFDLTATIDHSGDLLSGGTLTVMGDLGWNFDNNGNPINDTTLLTGNLVTGAKGTAYDYNDSKFVFLVTVTGGDYAPDMGSTVWIDLIPWWDDTTQPFGFDPDNPLTVWTHDFDNTGDGFCNTMPVPEPSSTLLVLIGAVVWRTARRFCGNGTRRVV